MNNVDRFNESKIDLLDQNGRAMPTKIHMIQIDELCKKHKIK